jgi:predicted transcriptional regulator
MAFGEPRNGGPPRRREATDLYASVLEVVKRYHGSARITRVSYGAGMPVDRLRGFLDRLLALGLLRAEELDGRPMYDITPRGQEFLDTYWRMAGYLSALSSYPDDRVAARGRGPRRARLERPVGRDAE